MIFPSSRSAQLAHYTLTSTTVVSILLNSMLQKMTTPSICTLAIGLLQVYQAVLEPPGLPYTSETVAISCVTYPIDVSELAERLIQCKRARASSVTEKFRTESTFPGSDPCIADKEDIYNNASLPVGISKYFSGS